MARYRKIDTRIWNDERVALLSDDGKLVFLFLLTHPHLTSLGAMRATVPGLAAELGWQVERLREAFAGLLGESDREVSPLVEYDDRACFIGLPKFLKYNSPENPNVVKSWGPLLDMLPECPLKTRLLGRVRDHIQQLGTGFVEAWRTVCQTLSEGFGQPFRNGTPNPEPEPKPEQEPEPKPEPDSENQAAAVAAGEVRTTKASKNKVGGKAQQPIPIPHELDTPEARQALSDWREHRRQQRKPLTTIQEAKLLTEWAARGTERFVAAVNHSIANGWQGLFEPKETQNRKGPNDSHHADGTYRTASNRRARF